MSLPATTTKTRIKEEEETGIFLLLPLLFNLFLIRVFRRWVLRSPNRLREERKSIQRRKFCLISKALEMSTLALITTPQTGKTGCLGSTLRKWRSIWLFGLEPMILQLTRLASQESLALLLSANLCPSTISLWGAQGCLTFGSKRIAGRDITTYMKNGVVAF